MPGASWRPGPRLAGEADKWPLEYGRPKSAAKYRVAPVAVRELPSAAWPEPWSGKGT